MPVLNGQLAFDDSGLIGGPVINDFQQIGAGLAVQAGHALVVEQQHIGFGQLQQPLAKRAVAVADAQFFSKQAYTLIQRRVAAPAGVLRQGAGQPGLARTRRAGD